MKDSIQQQSDEFSNMLTKIRRELHRYPELGWQEYRTTVRIIEHLEQWGIEYHFGKEILDTELRRGFPDESVDKSAVERAIQETGRTDLINQMAGGFTGVVAVIKGRKTGILKPTTCLLRFDIDANELQECMQKGHRPFDDGFVSNHAGVMHACGHDGHIAIGLGVMKELQENRDLFCGEVRVLFQPAEEEVRGAVAFAGTGLTKGVDYMLSGHIGLKANRLGLLAASTTEFLATTKIKVSFYGKSSHAGNCPQAGQNALAAACNATLNILGISRHSEGISRVNVGTLRADGPTNVIPDYAVLVLETRGSTDEVNQYMLKQVETVCEGAATMEGCDYELKLVGGAGCAQCDKELSKLIAKKASTIPFFTTVVEELEFGASEDVTELMNAVCKQGGKATYMLFGTELSAPHHNDHFDFDETVLVPAVKLFFESILALCEERSHG